MENPQFETLAQSLSPVLQTLEQKRRQLKTKGQTTGLWVGGVILAIGLGISFYFDAALIGGGITLALALLIFYCCVDAQSEELSGYYKNEVIGQMLRSLCENASFEPRQGISEAEFQNSGLFGRSDRYHTEDRMQGCLGKTDFCCAEVHAEQRRTRTSSKGVTTHYWVTIFKGFLFIADFHKNFEGQTVIRRNSLLKLDFSGSRVKLESPDFEKTFDVYATDQVEARYLITPAMMERLLNLDKRFDSGITVSLRNSNILVAIPESKNHFEASIWRPVGNLECLKEEFSTIRMLLSIVDELRLNTRIWGKE